MTKKYDIVGIGNAIVDILAYHEEDFIKSVGPTKGAMTLISEKESKKIYKKMGAATECSGGSAANTLAGFAMLGGKAAFIGKVSDDQFGLIFRKDITRAGVDFSTPASSKGLPTAKCLVFVTEEPGKFGGAAKVERTMATFLGACTQIEEADIKEDLIKDSKVLFFEGYLWDSETAKAAIRKAIGIAKANGVKVSFTLSDPLCVGRRRGDFIDLIDNDVDIFFANEHEIEALYKESDIRKVLGRIKDKCEVAAITRSEKGSYVLADGSVFSIDPVKVENVYDVTGAGDLYASGFLYGYVNNLGYEKSGRLASLCAAEVIQYLGGRPATKLSELLGKL